MRSLNLNEAAAFLCIHPDTLQGKARAGEVPGAKVGRAWVFLEEDLAALIRAKYPNPRQASQDERNICHLTREKAYTSRKVQTNTLSESPETESEYSRLLGFPTKN